MKTNRWLSLFTLVCLSSSPLLYGEQAQPVAESNSAFTPFTGKVIRPKVRLRTKPIANKETIWRELQQGELFVVTAETGEYYAVEAPKGTKGYIYRSYVIDGVVEGLRVNVRLSPDFDAPTITQVNTGDRVNGEVLEDNRKWLVIDLPQGSNFFVMKDYIEKVGNASLYAKLEASREKAETTLKSAKEQSETEIAKNYNDINMNPIFEELDQVISLRPQQEQLAQQATDLKKQLNEQLLLKKIDYYEKLGHTSADHLEEQNQKLKGELAEQQKRLASMQDQLQGPSGKNPTDSNTKMVAWLPVEHRHFRAWSEGRDPDVGIELFYEDQHAHAQYLRGRLEMYDSPVRNKPGDYLLINTVTGLPIAYLYSTKVPLQSYVGSQINIKAVERPNNHFAYPAYFVLEVE